VLQYKGEKASSKRCQLILYGSVGKGDVFDLHILKKRIKRAVWMLL
jgi:hypothetical protein